MHGVQKEGGKELRAGLLDGSSPPQHPLGFRDR